MQFLLTTLGCKTNQYESLALIAEMEKLGWLSISAIEAADVFILNSCTVTENSDKKTRRLLSSAKRKNPQVITVLTGCFPQAFPEEANILGADIICGTSKRAELPALIQSFIETRTAIKAVSAHSAIYEDFCAFNTSGSKTRAFIKIQDGCDCSCAYCIVPRARGNPRSRSPESIRSEVESAVNAGFKEIVLTGINLTKHKDLTGAVELTSKYAERVRLSSVEPDLLTDEMLIKLSQIKNLCPHFHLSLQSGSDTVLRRMSRRYTAAQYYAKIQKIRELFEGVEFTTDIIVGFPGETDEEFNETLIFAKQVNFSKIHVFPYSIRSGTKAALMPLQVPENVKRKRVARLLETAEQMQQMFFTELIGKNLNILVEKRINENEVFGHADNYAPVKIMSINAQKNQILKVKIIKTENNFCLGTEQI